jgi:hypothetical protein
MKAITVWQPWCSLILIGAKPYEFRSSPYTRYVNPPKVGERIALQAGARPVRRSEVAELVERLERNDPAESPCLHVDIALPFLRGVLAGLPPKRAKWSGGGLFDATRPEGLPAPIVLPHSVVLCTARLGEPKRGDRCAEEFGRPRLPAFAGASYNWGWPLLDIEPVMPPEEASGMQGFWEWNGAEALA